MGDLASNGAAVGLKGLPQSIDDLTEALVRCHELWRRSPGGGQSPWAKDGPWHLAQGEVGDVKGDWSTTLLVNEAGRELEVRKVDARAPRAALDRAEVAERDRVTAWLGQVADVTMRRAIWLMAGDLARGEPHPGWKRLAVRLRWVKTPAGLARACRREMALLVCSLNGWPTRRWRGLVGREDGLVEVPVRAAMVVVSDGEAA